MIGEDKKIVKLEMDRELYDEIRRDAVSKGYINVEDYIIDLIVEAVRKPSKPPIEEIVERIKPKIRRIIDDSVNRIVSELTELKGRIGELYERIERVEEEVDNLKQYKPAPPKQKPQYKQRKTGIEILHEQKILFESKLGRLRDRDRFFESLKRRGAIVLELEGERIAVDNEFWNEFLGKLSRIKTYDESEVRKYLTPLEYELFRRLRRSEYVIYDSKMRAWRFAGS